MLSSQLATEIEICHSIEKRLSPGSAFKRKAIGAIAFRYNVDPTDVEYLIDCFNAYHLETLASREEALQGVAVRYKTHVSMVKWHIGMFFGIRFNQLLPGQ
ncbi:MAG: hypothetical protein ACRCYP_03625 [Alphaproteobacteria bacterium]